MVNPNNIQRLSHLEIPTKYRYLSAITISYPQVGSFMQLVMLITDTMQSPIYQSNIGMYPWKETCTYSYIAATIIIMRPLCTSLKASECEKITWITTCRNKDNVRIEVKSHWHKYVLPNCQIVGISKSPMWPWDIDVVTFSFVYPNFIKITLTSLWVEPSFVISV